MIQRISFLLTFFLSIHISCFSQDLLTKFAFNNTSIYTDKIRVYPVMDKRNMLNLFALDNKSIKRCFFDESLKLQSQMTFKIPDGLHENFMGSIVDSGSYQLFFGNKSKSKFNAVIIYPDSGTNCKLLPELHLEKEKFLESFEFEDKFYVVTIKKQRSVLGLYIFPKGKRYTAVEIDLHKYNWGRQYNYNNLYELIEAKMNGSPVPNRFTKIDTQSPNLLEKTSLLNKLYVYDDQLYLTIDDNIHQKTHVIMLGLRDYALSVKTVSFEIKCTIDDYVPKVNSFLDHDILHQLAVCNDKIVLKIVDLKNNIILQSYEATKKDEISFRNSSIIKERSLKEFEGGDYIKEIAKTKTFFRHISDLRIGISAYHVKDVLYLTLGGSTGNHDNAGGGSGMINEAGMLMPITPYPIQMINNSCYSVYFKSALSNGDFKHKSGNTGMLAFDKIKAYENTLIDEKSKTVFKIGQNYVFGYCMPLENMYYLRKFTDNDFDRR